MQHKRVLIAGARGLLGTPTTSRFRRVDGVDVLALDLPEFDITDSAQVTPRLDDFRPDLVVNCAAYTAVDECERKETLACRVNGDGAGIIARASADIGARFIHISTDYVFGGDATEPIPEDSATGSPERLSAHGRSKLLGEQRVAASHPGALIVRTAWLYGPDGKCFPDSILRAAEKEPRLRVVNDQTGSPTYAPDLADALWELGRLDLTGIVHVTNSGCCTWYDFAREILRLSRIDAPITPVMSAEFPRPAKRPGYSVLDNRRYVEAVGRPLRHWQDAAAEYVAARAEAHGSSV
ncbi:MAG: dTDP-4-dehydrorhamnose reductase [Planctomycetota bacterium]